MISNKMISLRNFNPNITCANVYYHNNIKGAINDCYVRETVAEKLLQALSFLPEGYSFKIFDAWRPYVVQKALYDDFAAKMRKDPAYSSLSSEDFKVELHKFVSVPTLNKDKPFVHSTGGAVDLTLMFNGVEVEMGTEFDETSKLAYTDYFENNNENIVARLNRKILLNAMAKAGFTNLESEWWHFDYGDNFWSEITKSEAIYKGILSIEDLSKYL